MERNAGDKYINKRFSVIASSLAAISIAAGFAVEKPNTFRQLTSSAESASHLGLKEAPQKAYEQVIDTIPEAETAEALTVNCDSPDEFITWCDVLPTMNTTVNYTSRVGCGGDPCDLEIFDVNLVESQGCMVSGPTTVPVGGYESILITSFGGTELRPAHPCPPVCPMRPAIEISAASCYSLGGVDTDPNLNQLAKNLDTKSKDNTLPIAAGVAVGIIGASGAALYINHRRHSS